MTYLDKDVMEELNNYTSSNVDTNMYATEEDDSEQSIAEQQIEAKSQEIKNFKIRNCNPDWSSHGNSLKAITLISDTQKSKGTKSLLMDLTKCDTNKFLQCQIQKVRKSIEKASLKEELAYKQI